MSWNPVRMGCGFQQAAVVQGNWAMETQQREGGCFGALKVVPALEDTEFVSMVLC